MQKVNGIGDSNSNKTRLGCKAVSQGPCLSFTFSLNTVLLRRRTMKDETPSTTEAGEEKKKIIFRDEIDNDEP